MPLTDTLQYFEGFYVLGVLLCMIIILGCVVLYTIHTLRRRPEHICRGLVRDLVYSGWVFIVFDPTTQKIIYARGDKTLSEEKQPLKQLSALYPLIRASDIELLEGVVASASNDEETSAIIRTLHGKTFECQSGQLLWKKKQLSFLTMHNISKAYRKIREACVENESLRFQKTMLNEIINTLPYPMWIRDNTLKIVNCNVAYIEMAEENSVVEDSTSMAELFKGSRRLAASAQSGNTPQQLRKRLRVEGAHHMHEICEMPAISSDNIVGYAYNISALDKAEVEIKEHLTTLEDLLDSSSSAMVIYGVDMRLKFYNQAFVRMWGVQESRLEAQPTFGEMLEHLRELRRLPEQVNFPAFKQQRLRIFTEVTEPHEEIFYLPDGRIIRNVAIPHSAGGVLFVYEDVTDRMALERSYNTLIAVQRETLDNLYEGLVVFGEDGKLRLKNPVFLSMWGLKDAGLPEHIHISEMMESTKHLYHTNDWEVFKRDFIALMQARNFQTKRIERKDGAVLDCSIIPLPDGGVLLTYVDMTASTLVERSLREKNEALEAGDKLKTEFLANMSYELRSPLTSISGFAEMLKQNYFGELTDKQREYVEGILNSSQNLMHLIGDILDLSSIEAGYMMLNISEFDVSKLLQTMMPLLSERLREHNLSSEIECPNDIGMMRADETRIRQVLFHLLSNAVKYSKEKEKGQVQLGAERADGGVWLWVKDNGVGISQDEQHDVFEKFYRGSRGIRKSGTGLGLSMVKSYVELHGGKVQLDSDIGVGTTIRCFLPDNPEDCQKKVLQQEKKVDMDEVYSIEGCPVIH